MKQFGIHWFRRDLRVAGNPALRWNWKKHEGRVLGVFFFDSTFLARPDFSHTRFAFFLNTLAALREDLRALGGDLLVLDRLPQKGFPELIKELSEKPSVLTFNRDYEPYARARDKEMEKILAGDLGVAVHTERDHLLIEPSELVKEGPGTGFYQVYSPFARKWFDLLRTTEMRARLANQKEGLKLLRELKAEKPLDKIFRMQWSDVLAKGKFSDQLEKFREQTAKKVKIDLPAAGSAAAFAQLEAFKKKVDAYKERRDFPAVEGTSRLSIYFKNGSLTPAQAIAYLGIEEESFKSTSGEATYLKEIVWREFYYHILYHVPRVENEAFLTKYKNIKWEDREDFFALWKEGRTGYPIVDAGMRELKETGWMHNRVRMIVASFLTKDLLINWQWGERYFMEALLDGDLAPNNGGWQWAASTGCDPQPYFRIFNPTLQSQKFDPDGEYIKRYVPERAKLAGKAVHEPINPIVDHGARKILALKLYQG